MYTCVTLRHYTPSRKVTVLFMKSLIWSASASNRNKYQEFPGGVKGVQCIRLTASPPSVSQLCRKCRNLDVLQPYRPPWPVKGASFTFTCVLHNCSCAIWISYTIRETNGTAWIELQLFRLNQLHDTRNQWNCLNWISNCVLWTHLLYGGLTVDCEKFRTLTHEFTCTCSQFVGFFACIPLNCW
jgi:hypothetical protein